MLAVNTLAAAAKILDCGMSKVLAEQRMNALKADRESFHFVTFRPEAALLLRNLITNNQIAKEKP